jgi:hypothetical protein
MKRESEQALSSFKRVIDVAVIKGGIFNNSDAVIEAINSYNYLISVCENTDRLLQKPPSLEERNNPIMTPEEMNQNHK